MNANIGLFVLKRALTTTAKATIATTPLATRAAINFGVKLDKNAKKLNISVIRGQKVTGSYVGQITWAVLVVAKWLTYYTGIQASRVQLV